MLTKQIIAFRLKHLLAILTALMLSACASYPETLQVPEDANMVDYAAMASAPEENTGKLARWGGVIANIENKQDSTMLEIVHYKLNSYGRPVIRDDSQGRFRVYTKGFMDPVVYGQGRSISFVGELSGTEEGMVGEHKYVYPVIQASSYNFWPKSRPVDIQMIHIWPYSYWHSIYPRPYYYHRPVIIRRNSQSQSSNYMGPVNRSSLTSPVSGSSRQAERITPARTTSQKPAPRNR